MEDLAWGLGKEVDILLILSEQIDEVVIDETFNTIEGAIKGFDLVWMLLGFSYDTAKGRVDDGGRTTALEIDDSHLAHKIISPI